MNDKKFNIYINEKRTSIKINYYFYSLLIEVEEIADTDVKATIETIFEEIQEKSKYEFNNFTLNKMLEMYILNKARNNLMELKFELAKAQAKAIK